MVVTYEAMNKCVSQMQLSRSVIFYGDWRLMSEQLRGLVAVGNERLPHVLSTLVSLYWRLMYKQAIAS
jgi:hypothetical protein